MTTSTTGIEFELLGGSDVTAHGINPLDVSARTPLSTEYHGAKFDQGKARHDLVLPEFENALAEVLTFGAQKYAAHSWQSVPELEERYYSALRRHLNAHRAGELRDPESGLLHLAHAACNIYFLLQNELTKGDK